LAKGIAEEEEMAQDIQAVSQGKKTMRDIIAKWAERVGYYPYNTNKNSEEVILAAKYWLKIARKNIIQTFDKMHVTPRKFSALEKKDLEREGKTPLQIEALEWHASIASLKPKEAALILPEIQRFEKYLSDIPERQHTLSPLG
jgi:hypothetical protein